MSIFQAHFIQAHMDAFWGNSTSDKVCHFSLTPTPHHAVSVDVVASVQGDCLQLSYFLKGKLANPIISPTTLTRADFLWEKTCLECFFDLGQEAYFELNFSTQGEYNLYHFDAYRTPNALPPRWANGTVFVVHGEPLSEFCTYHLGVKLDNVPTLNIHAINPVAILYQNDTPHFCATRHANPPDFHDKAFWQHF